ncbi:hypothetical protein BC939DRAFT_434143 [Gamsiella multidivaricata]|uniref:uncharacterized protein n=1 Tax=Gamsiella multidivaricata TaxID=101098 RepID=UPI002220ABC7|nr:uncharacterized protein BC939DRAFT_434143 [Gamsiella multidivaricata]KAI7832720.1 hypothetical protein BC939DRAFT_434143 [Gamsiella multidivaricata]
METDDSHPSTAPSKTTLHTATPDYANLPHLSRESFLASIPRPHRHRLYYAPAPGSERANALLYTHPSHHHHHNHSHNHNHNHGYTLRHHLHYNPFTYRKFPPYQHWTSSAQRDYHLRTIGVVGRPRTVPPLSAEGRWEDGGEDMVLRPPPLSLLVTGSGASGGGVNKAHYRSRLPVHLRHMTARTNRRAATCVNPFQDGTKQSQGRQQQQQQQQDKQDYYGSLLSNLSINDEFSTGLTPPSALAADPSTGLNNNNASSSSSSSAGSNWRRLSDWKRVSAFRLDLEDEGQQRGGGMIMRLATNDLVTTHTSLLSSSSSSLSGLKSSINSGGGGGRHWKSQRGGLANLLQARQDGGMSGTGSTTRGVEGAGGGGGSTVDRLVEEMNKWSV